MAPTNKRRKVESDGSSHRLARPSSPGGGGVGGGVGGGGSTLSAQSSLLTFFGSPSKACLKEKDPSSSSFNPKKECISPSPSPSRSVSSSPLKERSRNARNSVGEGGAGAAGAAGEGGMGRAKVRTKLKESREEEEFEAAIRASLVDEERRLEKEKERERERERERRRLAGHGTLRTSVAEEDSDIDAGRRTWTGAGRRDSLSLPGAESDEEMDDEGSEKGDSSIGGRYRQLRSLSEYSNQVGGEVPAEKSSRRYLDSRVSQNQVAAFGEEDRRKGSTSSTLPRLFSTQGSRSESRTAECPICGRAVAENRLQAHANTCLDSSVGGQEPEREGSYTENVYVPEPIKGNGEAAETRAAEQKALLDHGASDSVSPSCAPPSPAAANGEGERAEGVVADERDGVAVSTAAPLSSLTAVSSHEEPKTGPSAPVMRPISELVQAMGVDTLTTSTGSTASEQASTCPFNAPLNAPTTKARTGKDAFSMLMKSHSESKEWAAADVVEANNYRGKARSRPEARSAPFYKVLQGMPISVDAFRFGAISGCKAYFLTHFHSDHYGGLSRTWTHGPVFCSITTANLVRTSLRVDPRFICPLPMETPTVVPGTGGVTVTCIEANHCPGSCLFLFEGPQTAQLLPSSNPSPYIGTGRMFRYLHCGDFRASPLHARHPLIAGRKLNIIYLDTTYLNPRYCFPAQDQVVSACAELVRSRMPEPVEDEKDEKALAGASGLDEPEDWMIPPKKTAKHGALPQDSAAASALKGWLKRSKSDSDPGAAEAEAAPVKAETATFEDEEDGNEEPMLEDEDLVRAAPSNLEVADVEDPDWESAALAGNGSTESLRIKAEPGEDNLQIASKPAAELSTDGPDIKPHLEDEVDVKGEEESKPAFGAKRSKGRLLVVVGTYTIGKEKIVKAVARVMRTKVFCVDSRKYRVYAQLEDPELHGMLTRDPGAGVHVTNLHAINGEGLRDMVAALRTRGHDFTEAIAFRPTGWTYRPPAGTETVAPNLNNLISWNQTRNFDARGLYPTRDSSPDYMIYGVPYSEHSSFMELSCFALSVNYDRIIATVNVGSATSRGKMDRWFEKWAIEKRRREKVGQAGIVPWRGENFW